MVHTALICDCYQVEGKHKVYIQKEKKSPKLFSLDARLYVEKSVPRLIFEAFSKLPKF